MAFEILISEDYESERPWIEQIPEQFTLEGDVVQSKVRRNTIKKVVKNGVEYNIKSFHVPGLLKRIIYTFFRKTKAERSYLHANILKSCGVETPTPVAYLIEKENGLIKRSYYVCLQLPEDYREIRTCYYGPLAGNEHLLAEFAKYSASLHDKEIYHTDYSSGNILFREDGKGGYDFQLVDINRMQFRPVTMQMGCRNFQRVFECDEIYRFVARKYAEARNFDADECERLFMKYQEDFNKRKIRKRRLKKLIGR